MMSSVTSRVTFQNSDVIFIWLDISNFENNNKDIKAFQIKIDEQTHRIQISQLADDTTPKMRYLLLWTKLKFVSGLLPNRNKTERLGIGKLKHSKDKAEHISWKKQKKTIPSPGIYLDYDYIECEQFNWEKKIEKMNSLSLSWSTQNIPMLCRALII